LKQLGVGIVSAPASADFPLLLAAAPLKHRRVQRTPCSDDRFSAAFSGGPIEAGMASSFQHRNQHFPLLLAAAPLKHARTEIKPRAIVHFPLLLAAAPLKPGTPIIVGDELTGIFRCF